MPKFVISGIAHVIINNPRASEPATSNETLAALHGIYSDEKCSDYIDRPPLSEIGIQGGRLRFVHDQDGSTFRITTAYEVPRELTEGEQTLLVEETLAQWSDGIGSGSFRNHNGEVLSTTLAMAIQNSESSEIDLGKVFVDAYPFIEDRDIRVEFYEVGAVDDELIQDLLTAADAEDASALVELGRRYEDGDAVEQNDSIAFKLYARAAAQGHPAGFTFLGQCYLYGQGVDDDKQRAIECFHQGAEAGYPMAMHYLGECYTEGYGVKVNFEKAVEWYRRGANLGDPGCLAELGDCLEFGRGIEKDLDEALRCYQQSLAYGFDPVQEAITRIENELGI